MEGPPLDLITSNPREIALVVLFHFRDRDTDATYLLHDLLRRGGAHGADARLATEVTLGVLRQRSRLDAVLETLTKRSWKRTPAIVQDLLRLGAYQMLFLDRIPPHAAVNETVNLARQWATLGQASLVNAVLRRISQSPPSLPWGTAPEALDEADWPLFYSHPPWLVQYFLFHFPSDQVAALLEWDNQAPKLMLRANLLRTTVEQLAARLTQAGLEVARAGWPAPETVTLSGTIGDATASDWFNEGLATVQDGAAQLIAHFVAPRPGERIFDWCSAPGGKSTHLAELSNDGAEILALDVDSERLSQVAIQVERLRLRSVRTELLNPGAAERLAADPAHAVLVDAPCTGLGTIQRHPDIRWRRRFKDIERMAQRQLEILETAAQCVATRGRLIYSTCTLGPVENEQVIDEFLTRHPEFQRAGVGDASPIVRPFLDERGDLHTWPPEHGLDGFYAAKLIRKV